MAITETRNLPAPFIQSLGEYYGKELPALTGKIRLDRSRTGHQPSCRSRSITNNRRLR